jgi:hypothetical protein
MTTVRHIKIGKHNIGIEIASYSVMRSPPQVITRKVKSVGCVSAETKLKEWIFETAATLKTQ